jgi:hypothetical protein
MISHLQPMGVFPLNLTMPRSNIRQAPCLTWASGSSRVKIYSSVLYARSTPALNLNCRHVQPVLSGLTLPGQPVEEAFHFGLAGLWNENATIPQRDSVWPTLGIGYVQLIAFRRASAVIRHKFTFRQNQASSVPNTADIDISRRVVRAMLPPADGTADVNAIFGHLSRPASFEGIPINTRHD